MGREDKKQQQEKKNGGRKETPNEDKGKKVGRMTLTRGRGKSN